MKHTHAKCFGLGAFKRFNLRSVQRHPDRSPIAHQYRTIRCEHKHSAQSTKHAGGFSSLHADYYYIVTLFARASCCCVRRRTAYLCALALFCSRARAATAPQCWCHEGRRRRLNKEKSRLAPSRTQLNSNQRLSFYRTSPARAHEPGIFNPVINYEEEKRAESSARSEKLQTGTFGKTSVCILQPKCV